MGNSLDELPKRKRPQAAQKLRAIYLAESREKAEKLARSLISEWERIYPKTDSCLLSDLDQCLRYFDYPREHWQPLRTTNPIESVFATMRVSTDAAKRFRTARSGVHLIFQFLFRYQKT
jgi:putative transposase